MTFQYLSPTDEKFELAKTIKGAIPQLLKVANCTSEMIMCIHFHKQVGEVLCRLEVEKRNAVQIENYDTAQKIKVCYKNVVIHIIVKLSIVYFV